MKFYVAARFSDKERVKKINDLIKNKGYELSGDWTSHIGSNDYSKTSERSRKYAIEDIKAVINCDVFILILNEKGGTGSSTELGVALALNKKIYAVGEYIENNMFNFHPSVTHKKTIEDLFLDIDNKKTS